MEHGAAFSPGSKPSSMSHPPAGGVQDRPLPRRRHRFGSLGIFRGDTKGPDRGLSQPRLSLVLLACGRFLNTSARRIDCQVLAEELAPLEVPPATSPPAHSPCRSRLRA